MSQSQEFIQEMGDQEASMNPGSALKRATRRCLRSDFLSELDVFSVPVKLNIAGDTVSRTRFGGLMYILVTTICLWLTWLTFYSEDGLVLKSGITQAEKNEATYTAGQTIFDYSDEPIRFHFAEWQTQVNVTMGSNVDLYAYHIITDEKGQNTSKRLTVATGSDCIQTEFCLRKSDNPGVNIWGKRSLDLRRDRPAYDPNLTYIPNSRVLFELVWCNTSLAGCLDPFTYMTIVTISKVFPGKGNDLQYGYDQLFFRHYPNAFTQYHLNMSKVEFSTNNKFMGHLANLLPTTHKYSRFQRPFQIYYTPFALIADHTFESGLTNLTWGATYFFDSTGTTIDIREDFDDISLPLLFFFSVKETFYFLVVFLLVSRYNRNCNFLRIADSLYSMQDHVSSEKYDFNSFFSPSVILACFLYGHPINRLLDFVLQSCGRNFSEFLPRKSFYAFMMIGQAEKLLSQNAFFGGLEELSSLEDQPPKKVALQDEFDENNAPKKENGKEEEKQLDYFPRNEVKREAFREFCLVNVFISAERKNHVYQIMVSRNLQLALPELMKRQFGYYVENVRAKVHDGRMNLKESDLEDDNLNQQILVPVSTDKNKLDGIKIQQKKTRSKKFVEEEDSHSALNDDSASNIKILGRAQGISKKDTVQERAEGDQRKMSKKSRSSYIEMKDVDAISYGGQKEEENQGKQKGNNAVEMRSISDDDDSDDIQ